MCQQNFSCIRAFVVPYRNLFLSSLQDEHAETRRKSKRLNVGFTEGEQSGLFLAGEGRDGTEGELMNGRERERRHKRKAEGRQNNKTTAENIHLPRLCRRSCCGVLPPRPPGLHIIESSQYHMLLHCREMISYSSGFENYKWKTRAEHLYH